EDRRVPRRRRGGRLGGRPGPAQGPRLPLADRRPAVLPRGRAGRHRGLAWFLPAARRAVPRVEPRSDLPQPAHRGDPVVGDEEAVVLLEDAEAGGLLEVVLLGAAALTVAMDIDVVEHDAAGVHVVAAADEDLRTGGVDHHGDPVQLALALVEGAHAGELRPGRRSAR